MLESDIIIFANSYKCPLGKRCEGCVLQTLSEIPKQDLYTTIQGMSNSEKNELVAKCESCQEKNSFFELQRA